MRGGFFTIILWLMATTILYASDTVNIGVSLGLTGRFSKVGHMQKNAYQLWEKQINERGGLLNRKVKITIYDDKSNAKTAKSLYERLVLKDKVDLVFGPYSSGLTDVVATFTEAQKFPMLAPGAAGDTLWKKGRKYLFGIWRPASRYTQGFLEMILTYNLDDIAIVFADDAFSVNLANGAKKWATVLDLEIVLFQKFKKGTRNLEEFAENAKSSEAQVLIVVGHYNEAADMRRALLNIRWYPQAYLATVGPTFQKYYEEFKNDAEYSYSVTNWEPHEKLGFPGSEAFRNEFINIYQESPSYHAATAYAAGEILEAAVKKTGSLDKEKLRKTLGGLEVTTILGRYGVDRTGIQIRHFPLILQWQKKKREIVWPKELATATPKFGHP